MIGKWYDEPLRISYSPDEQGSVLGIMSSDDLDKFHTSISSTLDHATTILEYDYINCEVKRNESGLLKHKMCKACRMLRVIYGERLCHECDKDHYLKYFLDKGYASLIKQDTHDGVTISSFREVDTVDNTQRLYGEYFCPYLGYTELIFPIFHRSRIIGVIFVGQILSSKRKKLLMRFRSLRRAIKDNVYGCFEGINFLSISTLGKISKIALCREDNDVLIDNDLRHFKSKIKKLLDDFENTLDTEVYKKRRLEIDRIFERNKAQVFKDILEVVEQKNSSNSMLEKFWDIINDETNRLIGELEIGDVFVFGNKKYREGIPQEQLQLPFIFSTNDDIHISDFIINGEFQKDILFPLSTFEHRTLSGYIISNPLTRCASGNYEVLFWPAYDISCCVVFVVAFENPKTKPIVEDNHIRQYLIETMLDYFSLLFSNYQSIWSVISKEKIVAQKKINEDAFSIFSHEIQQHTSTLSRLYENNLATNEQIMQMASDQKAEIVNKDFFSSMKMLEYLANNSKIYLGMLKPKKEYFYAFSEKIFKFRSIFSRELLNKNIFIQTPQALSKGDELRSEVFCDPILFEQIVYNLLKNALQYSHNNTIIYVDCKKHDNKTTSSHNLTVTNYGIKLDDRIDIYGMHERGEEAKTYYEKGSGIGLFVVKKIVDAIGGEIMHDGKNRICELNMPLLKPYMQVVAPISSDYLLTRQISKLLVSPEYKSNLRCIYSKNKNYGRSFICDRIGQSTWETTFTVTIPPKEVLL